LNGIAKWIFQQLEFGLYADVVAFDDFFNFIVLSSNTK